MDMVEDKDILNLLLCRDEIVTLLKERIDKFTAERHKARKRDLRRAMYKGFLEGFFSLGEGFAAIGDVLCGRDPNREMRTRVTEETHRILQEMDRDWRKAYSDFWEEERRLEDEISKKYGLEDRDDFFRKWEMYQEGSACK